MMLPQGLRPGTRALSWPPIATPLPLAHPPQDRAPNLGYTDLILKYIMVLNRPNGTSGKTFASGAGGTAEMGTAHSWHPKGY